MSTVDQVRETARAAVRSFADFYKANTSLISSLPNVAELNVMRIELLDLIKRVSADVEQEGAAHAAASTELVDEVNTMIETLRARRAELEHWLDKAGGKGALLLALGVAAGIGLWYAKKKGMLGGLAEEDCGCGG